MKMEDADNEEKLPFLVRLQPGFWILDRITVTKERGETVHHVRWVYKILYLQSSGNFKHFIVSSRLGFVVKSLTVVTVKNKRATIIYLFHIFPFFFGQTQTSSLFVYLFGSFYKFWECDVFLKLDGSL